MTEAEAVKIAKKYVAPGSRFVKTVEFGNLYILQIIGPDPVEGDLDPFFSVDKSTGAFRDFDITEGGLDLIKQFTG